VIEVVREAAPDADGPYWGQKDYIAWKSGAQNWLGCYTDSPNQAAVFVRGLETLSVEELASRLAWAAFDNEATFADKVALGSSVGLDRRGRLRFVVKELDDLEKARLVFAGWIAEAWTRFSSGASTAQAW
jgi:hypothetical protein